MPGFSIISELLEFNYSRFPSSNYSIPAHLHHYYQMDVVLEGRVTVSVEGRRPYVAERGDGCLIPPLTRHAYESDRIFKHASFKFHIVPQYWEFFGREFLRRRIPRELLLVAETVGEAYRDHARLALPQVIATATLCLARYTHEPDSKSEHTEHLDLFRRSLWPLLEQIALDPHGGWSVSRMARLCHLSSDYFSKCFHQVIGQSPQRYVVEARMRSAAAELLADPTHPIKEIAEKANYATVHAFSRAFTQVMGTSPAAYRQTSHAL